MHTLTHTYICIYIHKNKKDNAHIFFKIIAAVGLHLFRFGLELVDRYTVELRINFSHLTSAAFNSALLYLNVDKINFLWAGQLLLSKNRPFETGRPLLPPLTGSHSFTLCSR